MIFTFTYVEIRVGHFYLLNQLAFTYDDYTQTLKHTNKSCFRRVNQVTGHWYTTWGSPRRLSCTNSITDKSARSRALAQSLTPTHRASTHQHFQHAWETFQGWVRSMKLTAIYKKHILLFLSWLVTTQSLSPRTALVYRYTLHLPLNMAFTYPLKTMNSHRYLAHSSSVTRPFVRFRHSGHCHRYSIY